MGIRSGRNSHNHHIRGSGEGNRRHRLRDRALGGQRWSGPARDSATPDCHSAGVVAGAFGTRMVGGYAGARYGLHLRCHGGS